MNDLVKRKPKGVLHFGRSTDAKFATVKPRLGPGELPHSLTQVSSPAMRFDKQQPRVPNQVLMPKMVTKEEKRAMNKLPSHMHNINSRMACNNLLERTLRESKYQNADWLEPKSQILSKKSFRHDPSGSPPPAFDPQKPPKKKPTFT